MVCLKQIRILYSSVRDLTKLTLKAMMNTFQIVLRSYINHLILVAPELIKLVTIHRLFWEIQRSEKGKVTLS